MEVKTQDLKNKKPDIRYLNDIKDVLYDKKWAESAPNLELYYMYRGLKRKNCLRYDVTIIPPTLLGKEFVKTKGHDHQGKYGEVYTVFDGKGFYLMQKFIGGKIKDVYVIEAKKGETIVVPPGYGHVTINPTKNKTLLTSNWISEQCQGNYDLFSEKRGACYYYTVKGWIKNENYANVPKLRFEKPLKSEPENLDFLKQG